MVSASMCRPTEAQGLSTLIADWRSELVFYINGTRVVLDGNTVDPRATLLDFLRAQPGLTGTKNGCSEGGCGACTITLCMRDPSTGKISHRPVNACLAPLLLCDGCHVITVEGIGNAASPHPIQERMTALHGSQCGYCTPGIVMSLYALLRDASYNKRQLTPQEVELSGVFDGNLCRCTGYKPILEAAKVSLTFSPHLEAYLSDSARNNGICQTFVADFSKGVSFEATTDHITPPGCQGRFDKSAASSANGHPANGHHATNGNGNPAAPKANGCGRSDCCKLSNGNGHAASESSSTSSSDISHSLSGYDFGFKPYQPGTELIWPSKLSSHQPEPLAFGSHERLWLRPTTLDQLLQIKRTYPNAKIVSGATEVQVEVKFKLSQYHVSVFVGAIPELASYTLPTPERPVLSLGGNLPLQTIDDLCEELFQQYGPERAAGLAAIKSQLRYFAGKQVRAVASLSGNIATASPISDLNPVLMALKAELVVETLDEGEMRLSMDNFFLAYRRTALPPAAVIKSIEVPLFDGGAQGKRQFVQAYKQSKRKDDDIAIVTCAFRMVLDQNWNIEDVSVCFGGMAPFTISAKSTVAYLRGRHFFDQDTLSGALTCLEKDFNLPYGVPGGMPTYRRTLALSFFYRFYHTVSAAVQDNASIETDEITTDIHRELSSGSRDNTDLYAQEAVGKQIPHASGLKHCTGEAVYLDDMPPFGSELYAGLVLSDKAHAKILSIDVDEALGMPGVFSWVDYRDIRGHNEWGLPFGREVFLPTDEVVSEGQPVGVLLADSRFNAVAAAARVKVNYDDLPAILTMEHAIEENSFHPGIDRVIDRGEPIEEALAECEHVFTNSIRMGGQEHFYLETQAALVVPREDEFEVYSSSQNPRELQECVAEITGVPFHRVLARIKRMGGGFGGKETRSIQLAAILATCAQKSKRAVRCQLERHQDMMMSGQRHPFLTRFTVGCDSSGRVKAVKADVFCNGGYSLDISTGVLERAVAHLDNIYDFPNVSIRGRICKTNTVSNTAFRGFGGPQGMVIGDSILHTIADGLKLSFDDLMLLNMYKEGDRTPYGQPVVDWHVPRLIQEVQHKARYAERSRAVKAWNAQHKWRKRGICTTGVKFGLAFGIAFLNQASALVHLHMDGSVLVQHGGTEMGQGLYIKMLQVAAQELGVPVEMCHTSENTSAAIVNASPTAASTGSDLNGMAVKDACEQLTKRLQPYREKLGPAAPFAAVVKAAYFDRCHLSATGFYKTPNLTYKWRNFGDELPSEQPGKLYNYFTQGAAVTEVEVNCLNGDFTVLRTDIAMDVGRSLNPAVDMGQIEGAYVQGQGLFTIEETFWSQQGRMLTKGPGAYKIPGFADIPQTFNVSQLRDADWPNLSTIHSSKGVGEPPLYLGSGVAWALRNALASAREDNAVEEPQPFEFPLTTERIRLAVGDSLLKRGEVKQREGEVSFFVSI